MKSAPVIYLLLQSFLTVGWWALLVLSPAARAHFMPRGAPDYALLSFWLADLICIAGGSALASWWLCRRDGRSSAVLWFTSGSTVYGALYCVVLTAITGQAILAAAMMLPAAAATVAIAVRLRAPS